MWLLTLIANLDNRVLNFSKCITVIYQWFMILIDPKCISDTDTDAVPKMYHDTWCFFIMSRHSDFLSCVIGLNSFNLELIVIIVTKQIIKPDNFVNFTFLCYNVLEVYCMWIGLVLTFATDFFLVMLKFKWYSFTSQHNTICFIHL